MCHCTSWMYIANLLCSQAIQLYLWKRNGNESCMYIVSLARLSLEWVWPARLSCTIIGIQDWSSSTPQYNNRKFTVVYETCVAVYNYSFKQEFTVCDCIIIEKQQQNNNITVLQYYYMKCCNHDHSNWGKNSPYIIIIIMKSHLIHHGFYTSSQNS